MKNTETYAQVESELLEGKNKSEIFRTIGGTDDFARTVAATPYFEDRAKYAKLNWVLVAIVVYFSVIKFAITTINFIQLGLPIYIFPALLFMPAFALWIAAQLRKYRGSFYMITGIFSLAIILNGLKYTTENLQTKDIVLWSVIHLPILFGAFLAFFLKKRLCPYLGYMGAKTDSTGKYLFLIERKTFNQEDAPDLKPVR
jgi:hypothetical protein